MLQVLNHILIALLCKGHTLIVGVPGLAKTLIIKSMSELLDLNFNRIQFTPDPLPEEVRFVRSDQFSFVKEGIPAIGLRPGTISSDSSIDGAKELDNFLKNHYHQPSDDLNLPYSPKGAEGFVRTGLLLGLILADQDQKPSWNDGDFFGEKFGFK